MNRFCRPFPNNWSDWLAIEIKHCKRKVKRVISNQAQIEYKQRAKLQTTMSVPQLACILRSFRDTGIITNTVLQDMFKAVIESFETEKSEKISIKSLNNKYYDLDEATKEETKRILKEVLKNIR